MNALDAFAYRAERNCCVNALAPLAGVSWDIMRLAFNLVGAIDLRRPRWTRTDRIPAACAMLNRRAEPGGWYAPAAGLLAHEEHILAEVMQPRQPTGRHFIAVRDGRVLDGEYTNWVFMRPRYYKYSLEKLWVRRVWLIWMGDR